MGSNEKGSRRERELVNAADDLGLGALRLPASGSATKRDLPDVLLGDPVKMAEGTFSDLYAIEAKASAEKPIYIERAEVEALKAFSDLWGARPLLGTFFDVKRGDPPWGIDEDSGWRFLAPEECHQSEKFYRVKKEEAYAIGTPLEELYP